MSLGFNLAARAMETPPSPSLSTTAAIPFSGGSPFSVIDQTHSEFATGTFTGALLVTHTSIPNPAPPPASRVGIGLVTPIWRFNPDTWSSWISP